MIDLSKLDVYDKTEADYIVSRAFDLRTIAISRHEVAQLHYAMRVFSQVPYATIQLFSDGASVIWRFRDEIINTGKVAMDKLPILLLLQWLRYKETVADYEEAHRAVNEAG